MSALIVIDDGTNPAASGSTDLAVSFLATAFTLTNFDDTGILGWQWTLIDKPVGSSSVLSAPQAATTQITPDVEGSYLFRLQTYTDVGRTILDNQDEQLIGIRYATPRNWLIPAAGQTTQLGAGRGWAAQVNELLRDSRAGLAAFDMQDVYDNDPAVAIAAGTPIPLTTSGVGQVGLTVDDGAGGVVGIQGAAITLPALGTVDGRDVSADGAALDALATALLDGDFTLPLAGALVTDSPGVYRVVHHTLAAAVAPGVNDDSVTGYSVGSVWIDTTANRSYVCVDATGGAAIWVTDALGATFQDIVDNGPTATLPAATPVALTTDAADEDGITITDATATLAVRADAIVLDPGESEATLGRLDTGDAVSEWGEVAGPAFIRLKGGVLSGLTGSRVILQGGSTATLDAGPVVIRGGQSGSGTGDGGAAAGGDVQIDPGEGQTSGVVKINTLGAFATTIESGNGNCTWTHDGILALDDGTQVASLEADGITLAVAAVQRFFLLTAGQTTGASITGHTLGIIAGVGSPASGGNTGGTG
ncbi:MAG TPA: hypothetical protein VMW94_09305, partial [Actinomycetes bacterium]|nr:hypothetical protein [Actinomycetes bacterium]